MSERSEFLSARQMSAKRRVPAQRARRLGCPFAAYSFWASKKSKAASGAQPPELAWFRPTLALPRPPLAAQFDPSSQPCGDGVNKGRSAGQLAALHRTDDRLLFFVADRRGQIIPVKPRAFFVRRPQAKPRRIAIEPIRPVPARMGGATRPRILIWCRAHPGL